MAHWWLALVPAPALALLAWHALADSWARLWFEIEFGALLALCDPGRHARIAGPWWPR